MATTELDRMIVALEARITQFEKNFAKANRTSTKTFDNIEQRSKLSADRIEKNLTAVGMRVNNQFKNFGAGLVGSLAAGFTVDKMKALLDTSTAITNSLKVAGLSGDDLNKVYRQLYESAQRNSTPLDALVTLYSRVSSAQKELGVSTGEVLTLTDNVAKSIRLSGGSASEASGALLQLSQALGGGKIQAEEYNSLVDGLRPLLQAAAAGMKQAGGSVAELTRLVKAGEVSSRAFFDAVNAGAPILDQKLAGATATASQGFVQIYNALIDAARKFDETTDTSKKLGAALNGLATTISEFNVDHAVEEFQRYVRGAEDAINATNNFAQSLGGKIGHALGIDWIGSALGLPPSQAVLEKRMAGRMDGDVPATPSYLQDWTRQHYGENTTAKTDRLPAAPKVTVQVDLSDPKYAVPATGKSGTSGRGSKAATDSFDRLNDAVKRFVDSVVKAESGGNASAKNPNSSATGLGQFIESTWLRLFKENFPDRAASMSDKTILALRNDAEISRSMIEAYAKENAGLLRQAGVSVNEAALHLAHFLGPQGAIKVLQAAPSTPVSSLLSADAIKANPTILGYGATAGDVVRYSQNRAAALDGERDSVTGLKDAWGDLRQTTTDANATMDDSMQHLADIEKDFVGGLASDLMNGVSPAEALRRALARLADTLLNDLLDSIFRVKNAGGGGFLSSIFGGLFGGGTSSFIPGILSGGLVGLFADGGHVSGPGTSTSDSIPAMLSDGEFVVNAAATKRNRALLQTINSGRVPHLAHGGSVGSGGSTVARIMPAANSNTPAVTINAPVTVNASGGTAEQNADLAGKTAKAMEQTLRGIVGDEIRKSARPGAFLNSRSR